MPTVRHLGLFALKPTPIVEAPRCVQPAENFSLPTNLGFLPAGGLGKTTYSIAPATLPASPYVALTLEQAMRWHWRIKKWRVEVDVQFRWDSPEDITHIQDVFFADNIVNNVVATDEKQKVCDAGYFAGSKSVYADEEDPLNTLYDWTCSVAIGKQQMAWVNYPTTPELKVALSQSVRISSDKTTYYIPVVIDLQMRGLDFIQPYLSGQLFDENQGADTPLTWSIDDGLDQITRPFRFYSGQDTGSISITVAEYWPYDPGDGGGPIYDSATGAQLRSFPN